MELHHGNHTMVSMSKVKLVSDEAFIVLDIALFILVSGTVAVFGCVANLANITVFVKQGFQETANAPLFCLSVSDFFLCLATIGTATTSALNKMKLNVNVNFNDMNYLLSLFRAWFSDISMLTIVFLSLERCLCVVKPLTFKHIITKQRSLTILGVMYAEVIVFFIFQFESHRLTWQHSSTTNSSRLQMYLSPLTDSVVSAYQVVNGLSLPFIAMILVTAASCCMAYGLKKASQFRMKNASADLGKDDNSASSSLSPKDVRVVKMVIYVSVMFVLCYLPFMIIFCIQTSVPDVGFMKPQHNLNETFWGIIYASFTINSASNILVYLRVSSKYREIFRRTFCGHLRCLGVFGNKL